MMRWARRPVDDYNTDLHSQGHDPAPLRSSWADIITGIRLTGQEGTPAADTLLVLGRRNLKTAARWSHLLNDIPPPVITWNPTTRVATATRGKKSDGSDIGVGKVYISASADSFPEPVDDYSNPEYRLTDDSSTARNVSATQKYVSARVYGPDIDGQSGWSALSGFQTP